MVAFQPHHPGGMAENSPAFQRRDSDELASSPDGTAESDCVSRPSGTHPSQTSNPALKRRAIVVCPSGREKTSRPSNPSGMGAGALSCAGAGPRRAARPCFVLPAALALLLIPNLPAADLPDYKVGDTATQDIVAPIPLVVIDAEATEALKQKEGSRVPVICRYYTNAADEAE